MTIGLDSWYQNKFALIGIQTKNKFLLTPFLNPFPFSKTES
jgi:hypothetical protein